MYSLHTALLDRFLASVPVDQLDEADQFVREIKFMCKEHMTTCPITLYRSIPTDRQPGSFFRAKNRHRPSNLTGSVLNQALQQERAFERGLDINTTSLDEASCIVFLPDEFSIAFSHATVQTFTESASLVDTVELAALAYQHDISQLTEAAQHVIASNVPFCYCIRLK